MRHPFYIAGALLAAALWLPAAAPAGIEEDMVALDRAYIPALAVTSQEKLAESQRAMALLNRQWAEFKQRNPAPRAGDPQWPADLAAIDQFIAETDRIVAGDGKLAQAHEVLEGIRATLMDYRARNKMPYYLDVLTHFHDAMEEIALLAQGRTPATLGDEQVVKLEAALAAADQRWQTVLAARVEPAFALTAARQQSLDQLLAGQSRALDTLREALAGGDRAAQLKAAQGIKPAFAKIYMSFGDFAALQR